jgi:hypothetical protein
MHTYARNCTSTVHTANEEGLNKDLLYRVYFYIKHINTFYIVTVTFLHIYSNMFQQTFSAAVYCLVLSEHLKALLQCKQNSRSSD